EEEIINKAFQYPAEHHKYDPNIEVKHINDLIEKDFDNYYYVDYLLKAQNELDNEFEYFCYLDMITKIILKNYTFENDSVKKKYDWLITKYNTIVKSFKSESCI